MNKYILGEIEMKVKRENAMVEWLEWRYWTRWILDRGCLLLAGGVMLGASGLPWLADPFHRVYSPWEIPLASGWSLAVPDSAGAALTSVGAGSCLAALVCLGCATLKPSRSTITAASPTLQGGWCHRLAGICCLLPLWVFLLHFISVDTQQGDELAYHKLEAQLILRHLGYNLPRDWLPITAPFALDMARLHWRGVLLVDQLRPGAVLPLIGLCLWLRCPNERRESWPLVPLIQLRLLRSPCLMALVGGCLLLASSAPLGSWLSMQQVDCAIAAGDYQQALNWLERSRQIAPATGNSEAYQERLGLILAGLEPRSQGETVSFALARSFLQGRAYLRAYQVLFPLWLSHRQQQQESPEPWLTAALSEALAGLVEAAWPPALLSGDTLERNHRLSIAQGWLMRLVQVNPHSLYAHYLLGRAAYDLHNYRSCLAEMSILLALSLDNDLRSSAYTYIGLAEIALGHSLQGREALLTAVTLDPDYRNNTAREALSGLH